MRYIALDLETSDLMPHPNNVLTLSMVADIDQAIPTDELPCLNLLFLHSPHTTSDVALVMNRDIFLARALCSDRSNVQSMFNIDIAQCILDTYKVVDNWQDAYSLITRFVGESRTKMLAGKNVGAFDLQFLPAPMKKLFGHRILDPGSMYVRYDDKKVPNQATCLIRAGYDELVTHDAYEDNIQTINLIRNIFTQQEVQDGLRDLQKMDQ